jgi:hypothetical protein
LNETKVERDLIDLDAKRETDEDDNILICDGIPEFSIFKI